MSTWHTSCTHTHARVRVCDRGTERGTWLWKPSGYIRRISYPSYASRRTRGIHHSTRVVNSTCVSAAATVVRRSTLYIAFACTRASVIIITRNKRNERRREKQRGSSGSLFGASFPVIISRGLVELDGERDARCIREGRDKEAAPLRKTVSKVFARVRLIDSERRLHRRDTKCRE